MNVNPYQTPTEVDLTAGTPIAFTSARLTFVPATEAEVLQMLRLARRKPSWKVAVLMAMSAGFVGFLIYVSATSFSFAPAASIRILFTAVVMAYAPFVSLYVLRRIRVRRAFISQKPSVETNATWTLDTAGIHFIENETDLKITWDEFLGFRKSETVCLLFWKDNSGNFPFVQRCFSTQLEWHSWLSFLSSRLPEV